MAGERRSEELGKGDAITRLRNSAIYTGQNITYAGGRSPPPGEANNVRK